MIRFQSVTKLDKSAAIIFLDKSQISKKQFATISREPLRNAIKEIVDAGQFSGQEREIFPLVHQKKIVVLAGVGDPEKINFTTLRSTVRQAALSSALKKVTEIEVILPVRNDAMVIATIEGIQIGTYSWDKYRQTQNTEKSLRPLDRTYFINQPSKSEYEQAIVTCEGVNLARHLINDNADVVDSQFLESTIRTIVKGHKEFSLEILNTKELKAKGLNLHLAVNQGSLKEPKLIIVKYLGGANRDPFTALVGKGITFDTGGLNLKPTGHIETMRSDMSGGAAVIGTLHNVAKLKIKKNIIFAVGIAENAIGSGAYKPGDVFKGYAGKSVEILNTDAEGRLVLADALAYVEKNYKPARLIDLATLTGACVIALGNDYAGLVSNDDQFARDVIHASNETDDRAWRLPSYPEICDYVKSEIADLKNVGLPKGAGGAITAAEFLRSFVNNTPWVHLDIAGTAFVDGKGRFYYGHGATGFGVRLLTKYLQTKA